jgi:hypothetical protein
MQSQDQTSTESTSIGVLTEQRETPRRQKSPRLGDRVLAWIGIAIVTLTMLLLMYAAQFLELVEDYAP